MVPKQAGRGGQETTHGFAGGDHLLVMMVHGAVVMIFYVSVDFAIPASILVISQISMLKSNVLHLRSWSAQTQAHARTGVYVCTTTSTTQV